MDMAGHLARRIERAGGWQGVAADRVRLGYDARFLRRRTLATTGGARLLVDLAQTVSLEGGDAFVTEAGAFIAVEAAPEALIEIEAPAPALVRLAWHIGNRHTPAQIEPGRILIQADHVMADMLARLGASMREIEAPFSPERGAYGHGRTQGHDHGAGPDQSHEHRTGPA